MAAPRGPHSAIQKMGRCWGGVMWGGPVVCYRTSGKGVPAADKGLSHFLPANQ
jgi:hypothetical protein